MSLTLRPYQSEAVQSALSALRSGYNPVIALPTGSGKSLVLAALCQALPGRILIAAHVKELLQQNSEEVLRFDASQDIGVYSAGLDSRARHNRIIVGGVQSLYQRMDAMQQIGKFDYVLIDEAHRCSPKDTEAKMYNAVFAACSTAKRVGLSATPYRLDNGFIYGKPESWFDVLAHEISIRDLTPQYLAPLRGVLTAHDMPLDGVRTRQGDFVTSDLSQIACGDALVTQTVEEICWLARKRQRWLVFCVDVAHALVVAEQLRTHNLAVGVITGKTPTEERDATLQAFRAGTLRALCNCQVLTTGYNCPNIDCIAVIRPTQSKALFVQMIGRGSRQAEEKKDCIAEGSLVLTHRGLVPIEKILYNDRLWNGLTWIGHEGIVYHGKQSVITYAGLTATPDHLVWTQEGWRAFGDCANQQISIAQTGLGGKAIQQGHCFTARGNMASRHTRLWQESLSSYLCTLHQLWTRAVDFLRQYPEKQNRGMSPVWQSSPSTTMALSAIEWRKESLCESRVFTLQRLWGAWNRISLCFSSRSSVVGHAQSRTQQGSTNRPHRQQWSLRSWQSQVVNASAKSCPYTQETLLAKIARFSASVSACALRRFNLGRILLERIHIRGDRTKVVQAIKQTQRRVWDICNAGPLHCFTVQGLLVHNCSVLDYGGNIARFVPLDDVWDIHKSPERVEKEKKEAAKCQKQRQLTHATEASLLDPMAEDAPALTISVASVSYDVVLSQNPSQPGRSMLKVVYRLKSAVCKWVTQFVCLEYTGGARFHAQRWFERRKATMPSTAAEAMARGKRGEYARPEAVVVKQEGKWLRIIMEHFKSPE